MGPSRVLSGSARRTGGGTRRARSPKPEWSAGPGSGGQAAPRAASHPSDRPCNGPLPPGRSGRARHPGRPPARAPPRPRPRPLLRAGTRPPNEMVGRCARYGLRPWTPFQSGRTCIRRTRSLVPLGAGGAATWPGNRSRHVRRSADSVNVPPRGSDKPANSRTWFQECGPGAGEENQKGSTVVVAGVPRISHRSVPVERGTTRLSSTRPGTISMSATPSATQRTGST